MVCVDACKRPAPAQAHCGACHVTFNSLRPFDAHRVDGRCVTPAEAGLSLNARGVYSWPLTAEERARLAQLTS